MKSGEVLSDATLIDLLRSGDRFAFTEIYNRYWDKLFTIACHRLNDQLEAEEIIQDIFLSLWKRRTELKLSHTLNTYLSVSVKYQIINKLARRNREKQHLDKLDKHEKSEDSTELWLSEKELRQKLEKCIRALPEKCRIVFEMSRNEGKSNAQISEKLNLSEKTVEAHITKALRSIKDSLNISLSILLYLLKK